MMGCGRGRGCGGVNNSIWVFGGEIGKDIESDSSRYVFLLLRDVGTYYRYYDIKSYVEYTDIQEFRMLPERMVIATPIIRPTIRFRLESPTPLLLLLYLPFPGKVAFT